MNQDFNNDFDADLEAELAAALGDSSLEDLIDQEDAIDDQDPIAKEAAALKNGLVGTVARVHGEDVLVEISHTQQGVCPADQFKEPPKPGERFVFIFVSRIKGEGLSQLSRPGSVAKAGWDSLEEGMTVEGVVEGKNKGGLELKIAGHDAFMPISQVEFGHIEDLDPYIGQKMIVKIKELNRDKRKFVVSRRDVLEDEKKLAMENIFKNIQMGDLITGKVTRIEKYGAFIELAPGVEGLAHISDLSHSRVKDPKEVVSVDQTVQAQVLAIDEEQKRISLGLKQIEGDPWEGAEYRFPVGTDVPGKVTRIEAFGAFVELAKGVEGLIHISQISSKRIRRVEEIIKPGDEIVARVVEMDPERHRIGLSLKALTEDIEVEEGPSAADVRKYVRHENKPGEAAAFESLMGKFNDDTKGGLN